MFGQPCKINDCLEKFSGYAMLPLRLVLGIVFIAHGLDKLFGCFGGGGFQATAEAFQTMGFQPGWFHAALAGGGEFVGGLLVLTGLFTRFGAMLIAATMTVAILAVHLKGGLFAKNGGFEYPLVALGAALSLMLAGGGRLALDNKCPSKNKE